MSAEELGRAIAGARARAHAKHGANSIEAMPADDPRWLAVLVEEVGEVANALTYDGNPGALAGELLDVLAVAAAWMEAAEEAARPTPEKLCDMFDGAHHIAHGWHDHDHGGTFYLCPGSAPVVQQ